MANSTTARIWIGTIPVESCFSCTPHVESIVYARGQVESGGDSGYLHWQVVVYFKQPVRLSGVKKVFGTGTHWEQTRSKAAEDYVWKEETRVEGTTFEYGTKPFRRNEPADWDKILVSCKSGEFGEIPSDIFIRCYSSITRIRADYGECIGIVKDVRVYWGPTGTGKSRTAWEEAGMEAYAKDPLSKWWDGYQGQRNVVVDEFRGIIQISHLLRWFDRYPLRVERKGSSVPLLAEKVWITSNIHPRQWYPELDEMTMDALLRRLSIKEFIKL
jgi:hypothetical protein